MPTCRLLIDEPGDGAWNMAVDEVLLARAAQEGEWTLRFYGWREATLSLGYFQAAADRDLHPPSRRIPLVRRSSGGGAIVHDREITYSLAAPIGRSLDASRQLYRRVHQAFVDALANMGIRGSLCQAVSARPRDDEPFLCFQRRGEGDVLLGHAKIVGSAQRRLRGAVLQHGSLLLCPSPAAPELLGVESLAGLELPHKRWTDLLSGAIARGLELRTTLDRLTEGDCQSAARLVEAKYGQPCWNLRK